MESDDKRCLVYPNPLPLLVLSIAFAHSLSCLANVVSKIEPDDAGFGVIIKMHIKPVLAPLKAPLKVVTIKNRKLIVKLEEE